MAEYTRPSEEEVNQMNAISTRDFDKTIRDLVYEKTPFLKNMKNMKKVKRKGGTLIQWPVRVKQLDTSKMVNPRAALNRSTADTRIGATLKYVYAMGDTLVNWDEIRQNAGQAQLVDVVADKSKELTDDMRELVVDQVMSTNDSDAMDSALDIVPLNVIIDDSDTYAGIDPSGLDDSTRWESIVDETATEVFLWPDSAKAGTAWATLISDATWGDESPTLILTTKTNFITVESLIDPRERIIDKNQANLGFDSIKFKGIPIVADAFVPDNYTFGINMEVMELIVDPRYDMKATKWHELEAYPNALAKAVSWAGNLKSYTRHTHFKQVLQ